MIFTIRVFYLLAEPSLTNYWQFNLSISSIEIIDKNLNSYSINNTDLEVEIMIPNLRQKLSKLLYLFVVISTIYYLLIQLVVKFFEKNSNEYSLSESNNF